MIDTLLWIDLWGLKALLSYLFIWIPLLFFIAYWSVFLKLNNYVKKQNWKTWVQGVTELLKKEFFVDKNNALAIFISARFLSASTIIASAMIFNLVWTIIFAILGFIIQEISVKILEKALSLKSLTDNIIEEQNMAVSLLYLWVVLSLSVIVGTTML